MSNDKVEITTTTQEPSSSSSTVTNIATVTSTATVTAAPDNNNNNNNKTKEDQQQGGEKSKATGGTDSKTKPTPSTPPSNKDENHQPTLVDTEETNNDQPPKVQPIGRRSTRSLEQDPIIAPGYGTRRDLLRLTAQLNNNSSSSGIETNSNTPLLPYEAVEAMMTSRGRGIRSSARSGGGVEASADAAANAPASSSAWADFMKEEGVGGTKDTEAATAAAAAAAQEADATASGRKRSARTTAAAASAAPSDHDDDDDDDDDVHAKRIYVLPPEWQDFESAVSSGRIGKGKKTKTTNASSGGGGILVQAGTLDATIVGRKSLGSTGGGGGGKKKKGAAAAAAAAEAAAAAAISASVYHCMSPTRLALGAAIRVEKVFTSCNSVHSIALANNGTAVYGWGRNESQQLTAHLPSSSVPFPTLLSDFLPDDVAKSIGIASAATGKSHTVLLTRDGRAYAVGSNKLGQCATKSSIETMSQFKKVVVDDTNDNDSITLVQISCGEDFTMALDSNGYLYSAGCSQYGQLGNGETGEYFITANKLAFANCTSLKRRSTFCQEDTSSSAMASSRGGGSNNKDQKVVPILQEDDILIQQVVCGKHHTIAVEASCTNKKVKPRVFTWGCGDYGCLGHGVQKDEYFPRLLDSIDRMAQIQGSSLTVAAGAHCGLLLTPAGHVYYWGKHRSVGEAVMRPQIVDVLANNQHHVTHCAAGGATVICSTSLAQTVAWGQGPHGELGFGTSKKSSAKPDFVEGLHGCRVLDLAAGYGHTLYVVSNEDAEDRKALEKLEEIEHDGVQDLMDAAQDKQDIVDAEPKKKKASKKRG